MLLSVGMAVVLETCVDPTVEKIESIDVRAKPASDGSVVDSTSAGAGIVSCAG